ncbi:hypothetical protein JZ751_018831 [Albula glossodonta]|uniref:ADP-ribosyl cyclase/cyclic ADP-ribose hydrolase n=1 Tax=Albula glossodonta TaxID=121402 RepID=A0A8T2MT57_9TELE|nr:hypothetical protein JZ751_018831 [Albula glossodonta]
MAVEYQQVPSGRRRRNLLVWGVSVLLVVTLIAVSVSVAVALWSSRPVSSDLLVGDFESTIIGRCKAYLAKNKEDSSKNDCEEVWKAFSGAYLGKDPCEVSVEAYDPLMRAVSERPACDRFAESACGDVAVMLNGSIDTPFAPDSIFASVEVKKFHSPKMKALKVVLVTKGKDDNSVQYSVPSPPAQCSTLTPLLSSVQYSDPSPELSAVLCPLSHSQCSTLTPLLSSVQYSVPSALFNSSFLGNIRKANCKNKSLQNLKDALDPRLSYECLEVPQSKIIDCTSHPDKACGNCW